MMEQWAQSVQAEDLLPIENPDSTPVRESTVKGGAKESRRPILRRLRAVEARYR